MIEDSLDSLNNNDKSEELLDESPKSLLPTGFWNKICQQEPGYQGCKLYDL